MDKPKVGIIGGAGPMAGALLFEKIIQICQTKYRCSNDADFPYVVLLNYPFADMLTEARCEKLLNSQLEECFQCLAHLDITIAAVACNTLHVFLPPRPEKLLFVHMIEETAAYLKQKEFANPLVFCTSTSAKARLHEQFFACRYPEASVQKEIDLLIDQILAGGNFKEISRRLDLLVANQQVVLGCTELSLLHERVPLQSKSICDPNFVVAEKLCRLIFKK